MYSTAQVEVYLQMVQISSTHGQIAFEYITLPLDMLLRSFIARESSCASTTCLLGWHTQLIHSFYRSEPDRRPSARGNAP